MRAILLFLASCAIASAYNPEPATTLNPGDPLKLEPLAGTSYLQGKAPTAWEDGKVYLIDCWASWCVPCKTTIPRLNKLHADYQTRGLRVIGVDVFGEDKTKAEAFLKGMGAGMSYPVSIAAKDGAFATEWLKPANLSSLPNTLVVKNGKLLFIIHPAKLTKEIIEPLLAGAEQETAVLKKHQPEVDPAQKAAEEKAAREKRLSRLVRDMPDVDDPEAQLAFLDKALADNATLPAEDKQMILLFKIICLGRMNKTAEALKTLDAAKALAPDSETGRNFDRMKPMISAGQLKAE